MHVILSVKIILLKYNNLKNMITQNHEKITKSTKNYNNTLKRKAIDDILSKSSKLLHVEM